MLRDFQAVWRSLFILCELSISVLVFIASCSLGRIDALAEYFEPAPGLGAYSQLLPAVALVLWTTSSYFKLYHPRRTGSFVDEVAAVIKASFAAVVLLMAFLFYNRSLLWPRLALVVFAFLNPLAVIFFRITLRSALRFLRTHGYNLRRVLIVGTGRIAQEVIERLERHRWTGIRVVGLISRRPERVGTQIHGIPVIGTVQDVYRSVVEQQIDQVYVALPGDEQELLERLVEGLTERFVAVRIVPDIGYYFAPHHLTDFDGLPVVSVWENRPRGWEAAVKRLLDLGIACLGIVLLSPLFLAIAAAVKLTSRGPVFYAQQRMGLDGRIFHMVKFRTMRTGADERRGFTKPDDDRCTGFGRLLRRTSLDELPQLFNVIAGQMSLVGPRPERPVLIEEFRKRFPRYMLRHHVKAGMTGWAQVNGWRGDTSLRKRLQYDLYYLRHWSIGFDLKILALTLLRGLIHRNAY